MEQALTSAAGDEPELQLIVEDDEPEIIIEDDPVVHVDDMPTAPVETKSPVRPSSRPKQVARITPKRQATPLKSARPNKPEIVEISAPQASRPVARVSRRAAPKTFGDMMRRALALRPK